jgi:hypothetical protein
MFIKENLDNDDGLIDLKNTYKMYDLEKQSINNAACLMQGALGVMRLLLA